MRKKINKTLALLMAFALCFSSVNIQAFAQVANDTEQAVINTTEETTVEETAESKASTEAMTETTTETSEQELSTQTQETTEDEQLTDAEEVSTEVEETVSGEVSTEVETVMDSSTEAETEETTLTETETNSWDGVTTTDVYEADNIRITYILTSFWDTGYNAVIRIENTGSECIENWCVELVSDTVITDIYNAKIAENTDNKYVIKNAGWNQDIAAGSHVEFGVSGNSAFAGFAKNYRLTGESTQVSDSDYSIAYHVDSDWGSGFTGSISITNNTDATLEDWVLEFDFDREITSIWDGVIESRKGNHYMIKNAGYNANIAAGETVSFGFNGEGGTKGDELQGCLLFSYGDENSDDNGDDEENEIINVNRGITWDEMQDTDSDGLPDVYENENMLDYENSDTDGDGLLDGFEVLRASSDPLNNCTLENGIIDADLDPDEDGLTLLDEQLNDTDPLESDTDGDGIMDGDEVNRYKTAPLLFDTDSDELGDGIEIEIGLDPVNAQTFGYPDKDYKYTIKVDSSSEKLATINGENDDYLMDVEIEGSGDVFSELMVRESAYSYSLESNFSLEVKPEIIYEGQGTVESVKVSFQIDDKNIDDKFSSEDLKGINRYGVFYFDEEDRVVVPLCTNVDEENNVITAESPKMGTFMIVDMERWFTSLGYEIIDKYSGSKEGDASVQLFDLKEIQSGYVEKFDGGDENMDISVNETEKVFPASVCLEKADDTTQERTMFSVNRAVTSEGDSSIPETIEPGVTQVELVFCINNNIHDISNTEFESIKQNILTIGRTVFQNCRLPRIYILDQNGNLVESKYGSDYTTYEAGLEYMIEMVNNTPAQVQDFGKQLETLINDVQFRADSYRAIVFLGDTYLPSNSEALSQAIADKGARCIINFPYTQSGSWYDRLSKKTNGLLLYSYLDFSDDIIEFMFGDAIIKESETYNIISSMGLKKIVLNGQLNSNSGVDTDGDSLSDWSEIRTDKIKVDPNGEAILPTYYEYLINYNRIEFYKWIEQYKGLYDRNGKYIEDILNEVSVLPVLSDPTMKDSDGDGILDNIERTQKVVDARYECLDSFHTDTIETIYPELSDSKKNASSYPSYITVNGNDVVLHLKVVFKGDTGVKASTVLNTAVKDVNVVHEVNNITTRIGSDPTLKELVIDGIESRWSSSFIGNEYDFCEGLPVNFSVEVNETQEEWFKNQIQLTIKSGVCGVCNQSGVNWNTKCNRKITMYTSYCDTDSHVGKNGSSCSNYRGSLYHIAKFEGAAAHEMGHGMGLQDLYASAYVNHDYTIISNSEIVYSTSDFALPSAGVIMMNNGRGTENDIEMVILAFSENEWQYYVPYGKKQKMSKAIKSSVTFKNTNNPGVIYVWDEVSHSFK